MRAGAGDVLNVSWLYRKYSTSWNSIRAPGITPRSDLTQLKRISVRGNGEWGNSKRTRLVATIERTDSINSHHWIGIIPQASSKARLELAQTTTNMVLKLIPHLSTVCVQRLSTLILLHSWDFLWGQSVDRPTARSLLLLIFIFIKTLRQSTDPSVCHQRRFHWAWTYCTAQYCSQYVLLHCEKQVTHRGMQEGKWADWANRQECRENVAQQWQRWQRKSCAGLSWLMEG